MAILLIALFQSCAPKKVELTVTPDELINQTIHNPEFEKNPNGENFCWHARYYLDEFIKNYELTKDTKWLDAGIKYYDFLLGKRIADPDGYKGWIGVYEYDDNYWQDALVGEAILYEGILKFSVLVLEDKLLSKNNQYFYKANFYIQEAQLEFVEKWDKRNCWVDDGEFGTYIEFNKFLKKDNLKQWVKGDSVAEAGMSHPFNKQMDAGQVFIRLYRTTGDKIYRDRAVKIFLTAKSHFQYFDNHYCWNYFEPLYPGDVDLEKKTTRHGVWVHMWRSGYQAGEVEKIVDAYHHGIVFDDQDIKRIINTNLEVMWNKDKNNPRFFNSNGLGTDGDTAGLAGFQQAYGESNAIKNAGELWTGLLDFDQRIRDLYEVRFKDDKSSTEYLQYKNAVLTSPPSFKRKYSKDDVVIPKVDFTESKELNLATVLPHIITGGKKSIIICQSWVPGELSIDLYAEDGTKLNTLFKGKIEQGMQMIEWDGKDPKGATTYKGNYTIRWTIGTGYREFPVVIN